MRKTVYIGRNIYYICRYGVWEVGPAGKRAGVEEAWGIIGDVIGHLLSVMGTCGCLSKDVPMALWLFVMVGTHGHSLMVVMGPCWHSSIMVDGGHSYSSILVVGTCQWWSWALVATHQSW